MLNEVKNLADICSGQPHVAHPPRGAKAAALIRNAR